MCYFLIILTYYSQVNHESVLRKSSPKVFQSIVNEGLNLHIHNASRAIVDFSNYICSLGLEQHVFFPNHILGHSLDLVMTEVANGIDIFTCEPGTFISDYCVLEVVTKVKKSKILSANLCCCFLNCKDMNDTGFANDLAELSIANESVDQYVDQFEDEI